MSAVNITPLMFQCAAQSPRQARRASRSAAAVSMLCVSCSAVQQPFSLSLILKMFVITEETLLRLVAALARCHLWLSKVQKTLRVTMAAKIATYLSASHYFDLSINGNEKIKRCATKKILGLIGIKRPPMTSLKPVRKMSRSCQEAAEVPGANCSQYMLLQRTSIQDPW